MEKLTQNQKIIVISLMLVLLALAFIPSEKWQQWKQKLIGGTPSNPASPENSTGNISKENTQAAIAWGTGSAHSYFRPSEFNDTKTNTGGSKMHPDFIEKLNQARAEAGIPFYIAIGYHEHSNPNYAFKKGNLITPYDPFTSGKAVAIKYNGSSQSTKIVAALLKVGFKRIGVHSDFVYTDAISLLTVVEKYSITGTPSSSFIATFQS